MPSTYEPCQADAVEGSRICPHCDAGNSWLFGMRAPDICRRCDLALACVECGECRELGDDGKCALCREPFVTRACGCPSVINCGAPHGAKETA